MTPGTPTDYERRQIVVRARKMIVAIDELFADTSHWNRTHPDEWPIDPDPDGQLKKWRDHLSQTLRHEAGGDTTDPARHLRETREGMARLHAMRTEECAVCGDDYGRAKLMAGTCDGCRNEAAGLCACGGEPEPGRTSCGPCMAEDAGDARFHALHEEGKL